MLTSHEIRKRFLTFFENRGHKIIPSASLVPENDPSVLFNTAGMQPLVPYLLGEKHPLGDKLANAQKCVRTVDIDDIGDNTHATFFEMLGNWSLGSYFKEEAIRWSYEFLTSKEEGLGLDPKRLYVTVFEGDNDAPKDLEAVSIWKKYIPENRIYFLPKENNWWSPGDNGPCGPDTEMFYDVTVDGLGDMTHEEYLAADDRKDIVEIWNDVFMEYQKKDGVVIGKLAQKNVDTGSGLERVTMVVQGKNNIYDTDIFTWAIDMIRLNAKGEFSLESARIIADHIRTGTMLIADGVVPLNKDQGYVLRRLIRRAVLKANNIGLNHSVLIDLRTKFATWYEEVYPELAKNVQVQGEVFSGEIEKFNKTLHNGLKEFEKGTDPFILATTYGFPIEVTIELANEKGIVIDRNDFDTKMKMHQDASRSGAEQKFKGGLANHSEKTVRLHTAHHLLLAALQTVLGKEVKQKGSNITDERLRLDFSFDRKMTDEEKKEVENLVNTWIQKELPVVKKEMPKTEAETLGAEMEFGAKYADIVSVYMIGDGEIISKEFCGGPHVSNTKEIGTFVLQKEEASSQGVRRIKGSIE